MKQAAAIWIPFLVLGLLLSGCNMSLAADVTPPPGYQPPPPATAAATTGPMFPVVPPDPAQGASIYAEKCAPCHGVGGMGDGPNAAGLPNPVTALGRPEVARNATLSDWFSIVTNGNLERFMPPFRSLSDRQRWDVVAYSFMLSNLPDELNRGAGLWAAECAACHGAAGAGDGSEASSAVSDLTNQERMAGMSEAEIFNAISSGLEGMPAFGDRLTEDERWALAGYVRSLSFARSEQVETPPTPAAVVTEAAASTEGAAATEPASGTATVVEVVPTGAGRLGTLSGLVSDGSGKPAESGLEVNLHVFSGMELVYTATTTLKGDGTYVFENLELTPGVAFLTTVEYSGVVYGSDIARADESAQRLDLPIQVFESSSDISLLSVDRLHYFFEFVDEDTLRVMELYIISNNSDKTIVPPERGQPLIRFSLPPDASALEFEEGSLGGRFLETPDGFGDAAPIRPGSGNHQVLFSYELPYNRKLEFDRTTPLNTQAVVILAPEDGVKIKGDNLQDSGSRSIQGVNYHMFNGAAMSAGDELHLTISGRPGGSGIKLSNAPTANLVIGLSALGAVLVVAGAWLFTRNRRFLPPARPEGSVPNADLALDSREAVMDAILALDDLYQEGKLPEDAYLERRDVLKARLRELTE